MSRTCAFAPVAMPPMVYVMPAAISSAWNGACVMGQGLLPALRGGETAAPPDKEAL
ncbi:MAG TPA: hypothetical protein VHA82_15680 [Ramlibacter sp.]|nr:hypothetical protein [Ramlibacter sp.]HVZ45250.1 hypothetical protein [Ramlibacter sp.]